MSALPVIPTVPALPDDAALSQHIPDWPIFPVIRTFLKDLSGYKLFAMKEFGETTLQQLADLDTKLKKCASAFPNWYKDSPGWHAEKSASFWSNWRIGRMKELGEVRACINRINGEFTLARRQEGERRRAEQELEQAKEAPDIPASVSLEQASVDLPKAPKTITATPVYEYTVTDWPMLLRWLADNPMQVEQLSVSIKFTSLKYKKVQIPGVKVGQLPDKIANRG